MSSLIIFVYVLAAILLAAYSLNTVLLTALFLRHRNSRHRVPPMSHQPRVTVQLPVYNERYVINRLIDAIARLDWPRDRLEIQVLDDSTDVTTNIARAAVRHWQQRGVNVRLIHRDDRVGFKAGALAHGLSTATGEFIAIFDADFVPPPDFLRRTVPHLLADPGLGMVQARWGHLNADYSLLTRAEALAIDAHFVVEQTARDRSGLYLNFNGTAGVWRRECIESAGGWHADTLSEDVDLSYRAQLAGWRLRYLPDVVVPAELPPQIHGFKGQQFRWAKGSIQVARKLAKPLLAHDASFWVRLQGLIHLTGYLIHPLLIVLLLALVPLLIIHRQAPAGFAYLGFATLGPPFLYTVAQRSAYPDWGRRMLSFPILALIGTGIALSNAQAVAEALLGRKTAFNRTPKFRIEDRQDRWAGKSYALGRDPLVLGEAALSGYAGLGIIAAWQTGQWFAIPYMLLYALGFGLVAALTLLHSRKGRQATGSTLPGRRSRAAKRT
ncbi:MAG: glycosyltransferase [Chloroflexi bacterium]|nr:MAG: glycosyltransferase [Chloroflexota bacterium]